MAKEPIKSIEPTDPLAGPTANDAPVTEPIDPPKNAKEQPAADHVKVLRAFDGYEPGDEIDATGWLFGCISSLTQQKYVRALPTKKDGG